MKTRIGEFFEDDSRLLSMARACSGYVTFAVATTWAIVCWRKAEMVNIPIGVTAFVGLFVVAKTVQKAIEVKGEVVAAIKEKLNGS